MTQKHNFLGYFRASEPNAIYKQELIKSERTPILQHAANTNIPESRYKKIPGLKPWAKIKANFSPAKARRREITSSQPPQDSFEMRANIGVFPASGGLGGSIVSHISKLVSASQLVLIARHPEKLIDLSRAGATVRQADYDEPSTLKTAFEGVDVLMLISYASFEIDHRIKVRSIHSDTPVSPLKY